VSDIAAALAVDRRGDREHREVRVVIPSRTGVKEAFLDRAKTEILIRALIEALEAPCSPRVGSLTTLER